ncbi:hypothetical protein KAFR_0A05840 [Kazachstania africana CBS 2517]|uniref:Seipin n=1 Tax=Kazachstania africana (strain ATCC 22294 / BCRC 22015 / CBS 2517 / CECT 1963 / NBRC 1671 / NRRL Y-8276) TaxID=1071382 RepID=H2ANR9_KAZAF|nr:hypothetical protein KAFR_0A05840 [Kazachstania africana CBS 2517]CCF56019.1 hypothetical protein KAFR_0A05840 [Kazachstania africana CBS 2517]
MKINVTKPFQLLQYVCYIFVVLLLQIVVVGPLSILIFNDFYTRLIPDDSLQFVPISKFDQGKVEDVLIFKQDIDRISLNDDLINLDNNGISEKIPLREFINYELDFAFDFYCQSELETFNLQNVKISIQANDLPLYVLEMPIICITKNDTILLNSHTSRLELWQLEWLNKIHIDNVVTVPSNVDIISIVINKPSHSHFLVKPDSNLNFRMDFTNDLRNMMLRKRTITHIIGILIVNILLNLLFLLITVITFIVTSNKLNKKIFLMKKNQKLNK